MADIMFNSSIKEMQPDQLRRMQLIQVELLMEVDRICTMHKISYSVEGGTLLGAVRHEGFIPWDDDIDIAMLRSEYIKFCSVCDKELDRSKYFFQNHDTDSQYRWGYAKILRNDTSYIRFGQEHLKMKKGIYVEIFPMDGIPDNKIERIGFNFLRLCCRKIMWSEVGKISCKHFSLRLWFSLLNLISIDKVFKFLDYLSQKYDERESEYVTCLSYKDCWVKGYSGFKREYYVNTKRRLFEGKWVCVPEKDTDLLCTLFGSNYMQFPPIEERISHIPASYFKF